VYGEDAFVPLARVDAVAGVDGAARAEVRHLHTDHLGTPRELTDADGRVVWAARYRAWGNVLEVVQDTESGNLSPGEQINEFSAAQPVRFQGQYYDTETGLHYNRYRYYDPDTARYLSQDPIGLVGGDNLYQYAPSPTTWIDPLGLAKYVVIGEGQASVEAYAVAIRQKLPNDEFRTIGKEWLGLMKASGASRFPIGSQEWEVTALNANADWIVERYAEGYAFIDIGTDAAENRSPFYAVEKQTLAQVGGKVYKGAPRAVAEARKGSKESSRPKSKVLCSL
jgi:RHS repeat-associated protein